MNQIGKLHSFDSMTEKPNQTGGRRDQPRKAASPALKNKSVSPWALHSFKHRQQPCKCSTKTTEKREEFRNTSTRKALYHTEILIKLETINWKLKKFVHVTEIQILQQTVKFNILLLISFCQTYVLQQTAQSNILLLKHQMKSSCTKEDKAAFCTEQ